MAVFWPILFNSTRFHISVPALFFAFLGIYFFFKGEKDGFKWAVPLTTLCLILSYAIRRSFFIFWLFFLAYILIAKPWKEMLKNKYNWIGLIVFIAGFFLVENFIFDASVVRVASSYFRQVPFTWVPFKIFTVWFDWWPLLAMFIFGFVVCLFNVLMSAGHLRKIIQK